MKLYKNESGRSIIEMLGVLAIIALLSLLGIRFFKSTTQTEQGNQIVKEIHKEITDYSLESLKKGISYLEHSKGDYLYSLYQLDNQFSELFITDKNWDCTVPTETARHIFAQLMPYNYIWQIGSENENYLTMEDFEKEAKTKEKYKQGFCIWVFFKTDLRPRPTPHFYMIHDDTAPTSCVEYESNPCDMCIEQEGWPVRYERKDFGAQCSTEQGGTGFCSVERKCEDLCENMECPTGTTCEKGFCLCPNGAEQCGGVCCGANELCGDATNGICVPVSSGCQTNADCKSNQYCKLTCNGYSANREGCCASFTGTCTNRNIPKASILDFDGDGTPETTLYSGVSTNWWSAHNYCASFGKKVFDISDNRMGCRDSNLGTPSQDKGGTCYDPTTSGKTWDDHAPSFKALEKWLGASSGSSTSLWTSVPSSMCRAYFIHLGYGFIHNHKSYNDLGHQFRVVCE